MTTPAHPTPAAQIERGGEMKRYQTCHCPSCRGEQARPPSYYEGRLAMAREIREMVMQRRGLWSEIQQDRLGIMKTVSDELEIVRIKIDALIAKEEAK